MAYSCRAERLEISQTSRTKSLLRADDDFHDLPD